MTLKILDKKEKTAVSGGCNCSWSYCINGGDYTSCGNSAELGVSLNASTLTGCVTNASTVMNVTCEYLKTIGTGCVSYNLSNICCSSQCQSGASLKTYSLFGTLGIIVLAMM